MNVTVIIATAFRRTQWIVERSLASVYQQKKCNPKDISILIVDDNVDDREMTILQNKIMLLRHELHLKEDEFRTHILKNKRTRFMSGTGAWNTGLYESFARHPDGFVSLLDDDDEYLPNHLFDCISRIDARTTAVFQSLFWLHSDGSTMELPLSLDQLTPRHFFVGNPGVQGSNMFFKTASLIAIDGFDESLPNTTDRDLMIRFLNYSHFMDKKNHIVIVPDYGVRHHNHACEKVNTNLPLKQKGLDLFYQKFKSQFTEDDYLKSVERAKAFFLYQPTIVS